MVAFAIQWPVALGGTSPLRGRQWVIPAHTWHRGLLRWGLPPGPFISRQAAAYPADMNKQIVHCWVAGVVFCRIQESQANSMVRSGQRGNVLVRQNTTFAAPQTLAFDHIDCDPIKVRMSRPLRQVLSQPLLPFMDENQCICGLVNTWESTHKAPGHQALGPRLASVIDSFLGENRDIESDVFNSIGVETTDSEC